jgi:hypothetical protein
MAIYLFVPAVGLAAGASSGIIGTGASIMLLPVLVFQFGPKQAVPIMAHPVEGRCRKARRRAHGEGTPLPMVTILYPSFLERRSSHR